MRLILVRHGNAHAGLHGVIAGPKHCRGLTDLGRVQAARLADHLAARDGAGVDRLVASEIPRAVETAEILAPALGMASPVPRDCDLCEVHTGEADGLEWTEHGRIHGSFDMAAEPDRLFAPGGDSWTSFHERVRGVMDRLATDHPDSTVMAVCHAGVIAASLSVMLAVQQSPLARVLPTNTGLTEWEHDPAGGHWTLRSYNTTTHLNGADPV
ncbi:MAG: histidine phosphatase family protein [Acidimicrobiales bacterium]